MTKYKIYYDSDREDSKKRKRKISKRQRRKRNKKNRITTTMTSNFKIGVIMIR